jgi:hypothetical protein
MAALTGRSPMKSPGAPALRREVERQFWREIAKGLLAEEAAAAVGVSQPVLHPLVEPGLTARLRMMNQPRSHGSASAVAAPQGHVEDVEDELSRLLAAADQPTIARENTSTTNAT